MDEIKRTIEEYKEALNRIMKVKSDLESSTVTFESRLGLKKIIEIILWILAGMVLLPAISVPFTAKGGGMACC